MKTMLYFILISLIVQCPLFGMQGNQQDFDFAQNAVEKSDTQRLAQVLGAMNNEQLKILLENARLIEMAAPTKMDCLYQGGGIIVASVITITAGSLGMYKGSSSDTLQDPSSTETSKVENIPFFSLGFGTFCTGLGLFFQGAYKFKQWDTKKDAERIVTSIEQRLIPNQAIPQGQAAADDMV